MAITSPILKYPGSKWSIADWIVASLPPHDTYLEPFFGSGAVLFNKAPSRIETINDIDHSVVNLFKVIREHPEELAMLLEVTPWAREEYYRSYDRTDDPIEAARRFLVRTWQAFGVKTYCNTGWRSDIQGRSTSCPKQWSNLPAMVWDVAQRLMEVQIECQPALKLLDRYRFANVCIYADPPYVLSTRRGKKIYRCEMLDDEHAELLDALDQHPGPVLLSGYDNDLYVKRLKHWARQSMTAQAEFGLQRQEVLWLNPVCYQQLQQNMFWHTATE